MKFGELLNQNYCDKTNKIDIESLKVKFPNVHDDVLEQLYSDHGRNIDFQRQYKNVDIDSLVWTQVKIEAGAIIDCGCYAGFERWLHQVSKRVNSFKSEGWSAIDTRSDVVSHWANYKTWKRSPIFICGSIIGTNKSLWLVEGHTRVGILKGFVHNKIIESNSIHSIWLAKKVT